MLHQRQLRLRTEWAPKRHRRIPASRRCSQAERGDHRHAPSGIRSARRPTATSLTRLAERSFSRALAMYLVFLVPKALLSGPGYRRRHSVLARPVSSSHLTMLSQTSELTSTIKAKCERGAI